MAKRGRVSKSVLGQNIVTKHEEASQNHLYEIKEVEQYEVKEMPEIVFEETEEAPEPIIANLSIEEVHTDLRENEFPLQDKLPDDEEEDIDFVNDPIEIEIPVKRTLADLSHKELRFYRMTGIMPK